MRYSLKNQIIMHKSTLKKAEQVRVIVAEHYEPGRQDRCKLWVYRKYILPQMAISQRTFFLYLKIALNEHQNSCPVQLRLF